MSQHEKILNLLKNGDWVCSSKFYAEYIADPRTRLVELKKKGYNLVSRWCLTHKHDGQMKEWKLIGHYEYGNQEQVHPLERPLYEAHKQAIHPKAAEFLTRWQKPEEKKLSVLF
jgi:hypothetical protein